MLKKIQVVMLPTNQESKLHELGSVVVLLSYMSKGHSERVESAYHPQHLYFLSDEEIKKEDWYFMSNQIHQAKAYMNTANKVLYAGIYKIIATTDSSLSVPKGERGWKIQLPHPSQQFVEVFVREYNKGNVIKEVMVEYEEDGDYEFQGKEFINYSPRINSKDNTITIKRMKESWSREEVVVKVLKMQHDYTEYRKSCHYGPDMREIAEWTDKWLEQNL